MKVFPCFLFNYLRSDLDLWYLKFNKHTKYFQFESSEQTIGRISWQTNITYKNQSKLFLFQTSLKRNIFGIFWFSLLRVLKDSDCIPARIIKRTLIPFFFDLIKSQIKPINVHMLLLSCSMCLWTSALAVPACSAAIFLLAMFWTISSGCRDRRETSINRYALIV